MSSSTLLKDQTPTTEYPNRLLLNEDIIRSSLLDALHHEAPPMRLTRGRLKLHTLYHSLCFRALFIGAACLLLVTVPFIEHKSSFTSSTNYLTLQKEDSQYKRSLWWVSVSIEIILLLVITADACLRGLIMFPPYRSNNNSTRPKRKWFSGPQCNYYVYIVSIIISWLSLIASTSVLTAYELRNSYISALNVLAIVRQLVRPMFLIMQVVVIKKALKAIFYTTLQLTCAVLFLFFFIFLFSMLGVAMFPHHLKLVNETITLHVVEEGNKYFNSSMEAMWSLIVYLSTSNSPDLMTPAYTNHRGYFVFFGSYFFTTNYLLLRVIVALYALRFMVFLKESVKRTYGNRIVNLGLVFVAMTCRRFDENDAININDLQEYVVKELNISSKEDFETYCDKELNATEEGEGVLVDRDRSQFVQEEIKWKNFKSLLICLFNHHTRLTNSTLLLTPLKRPYLSNFSFKYFKYYMYVVINAISFPLSLIHIAVLTSLLTIEYTRSLTEPHSKLALSMLVFSCILFLELIARCLIMIPHDRKSFQGVSLKKACGNLYKWTCCGRNIRMGLTIKRAFILMLDISNLIILMSVIVLGLTHSSCLRDVTYCHDKTNLIEVVQWTLILVIIRMFRMLTRIPGFSIILNSLLRILVLFIPIVMLGYILYYEFAIIGIAAFRGTNLTDSIAANTCDTYQFLEYFPYNFEDFGSSLVLLWNLMIVNNWNLIVEAYTKRHVQEGVRIYFVLWWLTSEAIINGVIFGIVLEILSKIMKEFFNLSKKLQEKDKWRDKLYLVFSEYFWWGRLSKDYPILDLSWNIHNVLSEMETIETEKESIENTSLAIVKNMTEMNDHLLRLSSRRNKINN